MGPKPFLFVQGRRNPRSNSSISLWMLLCGCRNAQPSRDPIQPLSSLWSKYSRKLIPRSLHFAAAKIPAAPSVSTAWWEGDAECPGRAQCAAGRGGRLHAVGSQLSLCCAFLCRSALALRRAAWPCGWEEGKHGLVLCC